MFHEEMHDTDSTNLRSEFFRVIYILQVRGFDADATLQDHI